MYIVKYIMTCILDSCLIDITMNEFRYYYLMLVRILKGLSYSIKIQFINTYWLLQKNY